MTSIPPDAPARIRAQAMLQDLTWVAEQLVASHDRYVQRTSKFSECLCSLCRHARPWVTPTPRFCDQLDEREAVS